MDIPKQHEFVALIQKNRNVLAKVCIKYCPNNMTPDELIDDVIAEIWEVWPKFRGECRFSTWLYVMARNISIDRLRKFINGPKIILVDPLCFQKSAIKDSFRKEQELIRLRESRAREMIGVLSDSERELILLYADGKSYKEIEEITGHNASRLRVRISRIKQRLKEAFPDYR